MFNRSRTIADLQAPRSRRRTVEMLQLPDRRTLLLAAVLSMMIVLLTLTLGQRIPLAVSTSNLIMVLGAFALCLIAAWPGRDAPPLPSAAWTTLLVMVSAWLLLQVWPHPWLARLGSYPAAMWAMPDFEPRTWSPDPASTLGAWARFVALFMVVWVVRNLPRTALCLVFACVALSASFQALYGLFEQVSGSMTIFGIWERNNPDSVHGSFSNRNLYSAYLALCLPAVMTAPFLRAMPGAAGVPIAVRIGIAGFASLLLAMAVAGSASRGGFVAFLIATATTIVLWWAYPRNNWSPRLKHWIPWLMGSMFLLALLWYGLAPLADRFLSEGDTGRVEVMATVLRDAPAHWWIYGVGVGGFESAFRMIQPASIQNWFDYLHNDALQWLMEAGLFVGLSIIALVVVAIWRCREWNALKLVAYSGLASISFVAFVDFSWHIPATQVVIAVFLGTALRPKTKKSVRPPEGERPSLSAIS